MFVWLDWFVSGFQILVSGEKRDAYFRAHPVASVFFLIVVLAVVTVLVTAWVAMFKAI